LFGLKSFKDFIGTSIPIPFTFFPLPITRLRAKMYPPIDLSVYDPKLANDTRFCARMSEKVQQQHQERVYNDAKDQPLFKLNRFISSFMGRDGFSEQKSSITSSEKENR